MHSKDADQRTRPYILFCLVAPDTIYFFYGKCPKISYTKVFDKIAYANGADPDQTAPEGAV